MFQKWTVAEIICVTFLVFCLKNCYRWSAHEDATEEPFLKNDKTVVDVDNSIRGKLIHYQVAVVTKPANKSPLLCGGSLISKNFVLTAAHCLQGVNHATIILSTGNFDYVEKTEFTLKCSKFKIHPKWQSNILLNDIALLEVETPKHTETLPISLFSHRNIRNKEGIIIGWETNSNKNKKSSLNLRIHNVTIIENEECKKHFGILIQKTNLCTRSRDFKNGCHGFSGSPLIVDGIQVALVSFGTDKCNIGYPTVYTRVFEYTQWIQENSDVTIS